MEEPRLVVLRLEDNRLAGVFHTIVFLPVAEAVEIPTPVEALEKVGFLVEIKTHRGGDAAADLKAKADFPFVSQVGNGFDLRLLIDQNAECPCPHVIFGRLDSALFFANPPTAGNIENGLAGGGLFALSGLRSAAKMKNLFDAEYLQQFEK